MFFQSVIDALEQARVRFVVVGSYAMALQGAVRPSLDLDLVIPQELEQYVALEQALAGLGLQPKLPLSAEELFNFRQEFIERRQLLSWDFIHPDDPSQQVDILITQHGDRLNTIYINSKAIATPIPVATRDELMDMKRLADRPQDREDIKALQQAQPVNPDSVLNFLERFRIRQAAGVSPSRSKLISLKVPEDLLALFRARCELEGVKYQGQIKALMASWLEE
jgi:hypothetical protein